MLEILMISGSPFFQYKGNHSATYNVLKSVVRLGNKVTLLYPTLNYSMEIDNAREIMEVTPPGLKVIPVNIRPSKTTIYCLNAMRIIRRLLTSQKLGNLSKQFADYLTYDPNLNMYLARSIRKILSKEAFDIIQVDYPSALKYINYLGKNSKPNVYVHHEIQAIRAERTFQFDKQPHVNIIQKIREVESHFLKKYNAIIVFSETDSQKLKELYSLDSLVSPLSVDTDFFRRRQTVLNNKNLIFSGGENHYPNKDAVEWLCADIVPILNKRLENYKIYISGKWSDETKHRLSSDRTVFTGYVKDLRDYLSGSISLAPIRIGSGMRIKILEAMAMECIVVSTSIGCEGLGVTDGKHLFVADGAEEFADRISQVYQDNDIKKLNKIGIDARRFVVKNYGLEVTGKRRVEVLKQIIGRRHREDSAV